MITFSLSPGPVSKHRFESNSACNRVCSPALANLNPVIKAAAELALKAGDEELASRIKAFQFRDIRARSASDIADLGAASSLLGHSEKVITEKVYRRIGQAVRPTR